MKIPCLGTFYKIPRGFIDSRTKREGVFYLAGLKNDQLFFTDSIPKEVSVYISNC